MFAVVTNCPGKRHWVLGKRHWELGKDTGNWVKGTGYWVKTNVCTREGNCVPMNGWCNAELWDKVPWSLIWKWVLSLLWLARTALWLAKSSKNTNSDEHFTQYSIQHKSKNKWIDVMESDCMWSNLITLYLFHTFSGRSIPLVHDRSSDPCSGTSVHPGTSPNPFHCKHSACRSFQISSQSRRGRWWGCHFWGWTFLWIKQMTQSCQSRQSWVRLTKFLFHGHVSKQQHQFIFSR